MPKKDYLNCYTAVFNEGKVGDIFYGRMLVEKGWGKALV